jgi:oligopeptidase A
VKAAKNFRAATMMLRQLYFAVTDLTLHSSYDPSGPRSIHDLMREISKSYQVRR